MKIRSASIAVAAVVACLLAGGAQAVTFNDPVGDTIVLPEGADVSTVTRLDISTVDVTNTPAGVLTFRVNVTSPTIGPATIVSVDLDLDRNTATGDEGVEAILTYVVNPDGSTSLDFERWNGSALAPVTTTMATASFAAGIVTFTVPRSELEDTRGFNFESFAIAFRSDLMAFVADVAPNTTQPYSYDLTGLAPPPPPRLTASRAVGAPVRPTAGRAFSVSTVVKRQDTGATLRTGTVACVVRVGTARVRAVGRFSGGRARCALTVPRTARGKTLRGTMTIRAADATVRVNFSFRVR